MYKICCCTKENSSTVSDEVDESKSKKIKIKTDKESLLKAADNYAEEAEHRHKITLIAKSSAMRKAAKQKDVELKAVEQQLNEKVQELSNCLWFSHGSLSALQTVSK